MNLKTSLYIAASFAILTAVSADRTAKVASDGRTDSTALLQAEIDAVSRAGGGRLTVPAGAYVVGGLELKNNVELHLPAGTELLAVTNTDWYPANKIMSVVFAQNATNIAITGKGKIDGRGDCYNRVLSRNPLRLRGGWRTLHFRHCRNARVEDVTILGGTGWTCKMDFNDGLVFRGITMRAHANYNNDGLDLLSRNVLVENCDIDAEDDAIVFKTEEPGQSCENVVVRNCRLNSNSSVCKFGTESHGTFRNVRVYNCTLGCALPSRYIPPHKFPGEEKDVRTHAISGIEVSSVDGARLEDVTISNIVMEAGINCPFYVRMNRRRDSRIPGGASLRNILLADIHMKHPATSAVASSITGLPDMRPTDITIRDCTFISAGGGTAANAAETFKDEGERCFPMPMRPFRSALPAWGCYLRHADGVKFENVKFLLQGTDARPPVVSDDAKVMTTGCNFTNTVRSR